MITALKKSIIYSFRVWLSHQDTFENDVNKSEFNLSSST